MKYLIYCFYSFYFVSYSVVTVNCCNISHFFSFFLFTLFLFHKPKALRTMVDVNPEEPLGSTPTEIWESINRFYHSSKKPLNIIIGNNCDAAAASLTLTSLLRSSLISFSIHPVASYDELSSVVENIKIAQDYSQSMHPKTAAEEMFFLLGIGGPLPLSEIFDFSRHVVILLDSERPIHLDNIRQAVSGENRLILWSCGRVQEDVDMFFQRVARQEQARKRKALSRKEGKRRRREMLNGDGTADNSSSEESSEEDLEDEDYLTVDVDDGANPIELIDWLTGEGLSETAQKMYEASGGGAKSCAAELFDLSTVLNRMSEVFLWHAAVGVCDLFRRRCIDYSAYLEEMTPLYHAVSLHLATRKSEGPLRSISLNTVHLANDTSSNAMRLLILDQPPLFLLQHVSLWCSLWNDPAVASALGFHHVENGENALKFLLAKCGISIELAMRPWYEIPADEKKSLLHLVQKELKSYFNGSSTAFSSANSIRTIARAVGFSKEVTTFDVCVLFDNMLSACPPPSIYSVTEEEKNAGEAEKVVAKKLGEFYRTQFWMAHKMIDIDPNRKEFHSAVAEAVLLHRQVGAATSALMQPSLILSTQGLHYVQLNDPGKTASALEAFYTPERLQLLANRLLYTLTVERESTRRSGLIRPLLLAAPVPSAVNIQKAKKGRDLETGKDIAAADDEEVTHVVLMASPGVSGIGLSYHKERDVFNECIQKQDAFAIPPRRTFVKRNCATVKGRENAIHLTEMMYLRSLGI